MGQKLSDWQRLESVIEWANMTTNYFARQIGLKRAENLYRIKRGSNFISRNLATQIVERFPEINPAWLATGYGEMLSDPAETSLSKPLFNVGVEENIRNIESMSPDEQLILPSKIDCDICMPYLGRAMGESTPTNTILLLKKILPEMIIPGDECVIVTKKIVLLRIASFEYIDSGNTLLHLTAINSESFGEVVVDVTEVEAAYKIKGKIIINN